MYKTIKVQTMTRPSIYIIDGKSFWRTVLFTTKENVNVIDVVGKYNDLIIEWDDSQVVNLEFFKFKNAHVALYHQCDIRYPVYIFTFDSAVFGTKKLKNTDFNATIAKNNFETGLTEERREFILNLFNKHLARIESVSCEEVCFALNINDIHENLPEINYLKKLFNDKGFQIGEIIPDFNDNFWMKVSW